MQDNKIIQIKTSKQSDIISRTVLVLQSGGVIVYPTDTVYGIGCDALNRQAIERIYEIKNRPKTKLFVLLAGSTKMIEDFFVINSEQKKYILENQGTPTSFILSPIKPFPVFDGIVQGVAVRIPAIDYLCEIINKLNTPIVSTSLNKSSEQLLEDLDDLENSFKREDFDLILNAGRLSTSPSRLVDARDMENIKILRR